MSRLFGSIESDEVRDFKLNQLDARILEGEETVQERQIGLQWVALLTDDILHEATAKY